VNRSYEIPSARRAEVAQAVELLANATKVVLTTHVNADGDGAGSEAALLSLLGSTGAEAWIVNPTAFPPHLSFLVEEDRRILEAGGSEARDRCREADLCVVLDTSERSRVGRVGPLVADRPTLVIDHHPPGNDTFEGAILRDTSAAAAGELVFDVVHASGGPWSRSVTDGIYVALMTDTGSFRFSNVTPAVHRIVAELMDRGASPDELYRRVYGRVPLRRVRLLQAVLPSLQVSGDGRVAWISISGETMRDLGCTSDDLEGIVDYPRELEDVEVALLFRELEDGQVKVSFRSNGLVDVNMLARGFGGGGHTRASGALVSGSLEEVQPRVVEGVIEASRAVGNGSPPGEVSSEL
jgi:phosphoesterase RecJ-like protein